MKLGYIARNIQTGEFIPLEGNSPRKALMKHFGRKSARKVYVDLKSGGCRHTGYIVAGQWCDVFQVHSFKS